MKQELKGILSAILTPFSSDRNSIDESAYKRLIEFQIEAGIHGVVLSGSTGEHPSLTIAERRRLFEIGSEVGSRVMRRSSASIRCSWSRLTSTGSSSPTCSASSKRS
jgi:dihydrodipicolinate synthase/N-acetylneuraminate lyase